MSEAQRILGLRSQAVREISERTQRLHWMDRGVRHRAPQAAGCRAKILGLLIERVNKHVGERRADIVGRASIGKSRPGARTRLLARVVAGGFSVHLADVLPGLGRTPDQPACLDRLLEVLGCVLLGITGEPL